MITVEYLREFRILGFTLFDSSLAFAGVLLVSPILNRLAKKLHLHITTKHWLWLTLPFSVLAHILANTYTPLVNQILDPKGYYAPKIILLAMLYMGLKDVKKKK